MCSTTKNLFLFSLVWQTVGAKYQHPNIFFFRLRLCTRKQHANFGWRLFFFPRSAQTPTVIMFLFFRGGSAYHVCGWAGGVLSRGARLAGWLDGWVWNSSRGRGTRHAGVELVMWAWNSSRGHGTRHVGVELGLASKSRVWRRKVEFGVQKSRLIVPGF